MSDYDTLLILLEKELQELQFSEFTSETALTIGLDLIERAKKTGGKIAIDIAMNGRQLFHYSSIGASPSNDDWIIRKNRVVNLTYKSTHYVRTLLGKLNKSFEELYFKSSSDYAAYGGGFPLTIKNVGTVGTITVSGLPAEQDHELVVSAIKAYLSAS